MKTNRTLMRFTFSFGNIAISSFFVQHLDNTAHYLGMLNHNKPEGRSTGDVKNNSNIVNHYRARTPVCVSALANLLQVMLGIGIKPWNRYATWIPSLLRSASKRWPGFNSPCSGWTQECGTLEEATFLLARLRLATDLWPSTFDSVFRVWLLSLM